MDATPHGTKRHGRAGIALVAVLWVLVLLSVMAAGLLRDTGVETQIARNLIEGAEARALADAAVYRAVIGLTDPDAERRWQGDGRVYPWTFAGGEVAITIFDEAGKVDLNLSSEDLIEGLFVSLGAEPEHAHLLVHAIADFRDEDDVARADGAEDDDYRAAGLAWEAKDARFETVAELEQVIGMTRELYDRVAPYLTVVAKQRGRVDPAITQEVVLRAIPGVNAAQLQALLDARADSDDADATGLAELTGVRSYVRRSRREVFTIRAEVLTESGAGFVREAIVRLTPRQAQPFQIHAWRQGKPAATYGIGEF